MPIAMAGQHMALALEQSAGVWQSSIRIPPPHALAATQPTAAGERRAQQTSPEPQSSGPSQTAARPVQAPSEAMHIVEDPGSPG